MTPRELDFHFNAAKREGASFKSTCDLCARPKCTVFAAAFRHKQRQEGMPDPGNICACCAVRWERVTVGIREEIRRSRAH